MRESGASEGRGIGWHSGDDGRGRFDLAFASRKQQRPLNGETDFFALLIDFRLGGLNAQHSAVGPDFVIDEMSRVAAHLDPAANRTHWA